MSLYKIFFKRFIDLVVSIIVLICFLPLFLLVAIVIKIDTRGPVFFLQNRVGKNGVIFKILKFRTMTHKLRTTHKEIYENNSEVTLSGRYLRRFKIDELPQIVNVIVGDLSLVGPRPGLQEQLKDYNEVAKERLKVRPGLTGLAQINGNIYLPWKERWMYDKYYIDNLNFTLDIFIVIRTILVLIYGEKKYLKEI